MLSKIDTPKKKKILWIAGAALALAVVLFAVFSGGLVPAEETYPSTPTLPSYAGAAYVLSACQRMDLALTEKINVKFVPVQSEDLSYPVGGLRYEIFYVGVGDVVKQGDLLAELDMEDLQETADAADQTISSYALQKKQTEEARQLALQRAAAQYPEQPTALAQAIAGVNTTFDARIREIDDKIYIARLQKAAAEQEMDSRRLYAPYDGAVTYVYIPQPTETSVYGKRVITLADASLSVFRAETTYWESFPEGMAVQITAGEAQYAATVRSEASLGLPETERLSGGKGYVYFVLDQPAYDLADNAGGSLLLTLDSRTDTLAVPAAAVSIIDGETVVYCLNDRGFRTYKPVKVGLVGESYVEILEGLAEGEEVIIR